MMILTKEDLKHGLKFNHNTEGIWTLEQEGPNSWFLYHPNKPYVFHTAWEILGIINREFTLIKEEEQVPTYIIGEDLYHKIFILQKESNELGSTLDFVRREIGEESLSYKLVNEAFIAKQKELSKARFEKYEYTSAEIISTVTAGEVFNLMDSTESHIKELQEGLDKLNEYYLEDHSAIITLEAELTTAKNDLEKLRLRSYPIKEEE